ncbi:MAG: EMC3/TMCO1 family protein, partial [Halobacteria archaeon]|nr:EMC3/TMCO1 family protein [Halobacteria archaeon]
IEWKDVKTDATSGQWGRLIEKGILVESGDGFELADETAVRRALGKEVKTESSEASESSPSSTSEVEVEDIDTSWSLLDKAAAGVGAFFIIFGYRDPNIQAAIGKTIDTVALPLHNIGLPYYLLILLLATLTGLYSSYLQLYLMDWDWISAQQEKVQNIQSELKEAQLGDDDEKQAELQDEQKEVMSEQMKMFKMQFKPSVWIMVITIPLFIWMYWSFTSRAGIPPAVLRHGTMPEIQLPFLGHSVPFNQTVLGFLPIGQAWFIWYILCSFGFGQIMRKVLGVKPST